jgi:hypothetical protein
MWPWLEIKEMAVAALMFPVWVMQAGPVVAKAV